MERYTYLAHHGVKGQKWHRRQYQNPDGSYTDLGREHYGIGKPRTKIDSKQIDAYKKKAKKFADNTFNYNVQNALNGASKAAMLTASTYCGQFASAYLPSLSASAVSAGKAAIASIMSGGSLPVAAGLAGTAAGYAAYKAIKSHRDKKAGVDKRSEEASKAGSSNAVTDALKTGNWRSAYRKLHNDGYRPSEIAKMLGQSTKDDGKPSGETRKWASKYKVNNRDISSLKARQSRARSLKSSGKTIAEIADIMGAPVYSIKDYLYEDFDSLR